MTMPRPIKIDPAYRRRVRLKGGVVVQVRLIGLPDRDRFVAGFERLSPESRYRRFFVPCLLYTSPSPRDQRGSRMPSSA